jgi:hypothetical protein
LKPKLWVRSRIFCNIEISSTTARQPPSLHKKKGAVVRLLSQLNFCV